MDSRYRIIVSNRNKNIYKEIELPAEATRLTLGTGVSCDVRLHKSLFFEPVELVFTKDGGQWHLSCADNLYLQEGDVKKLISHSLEHGDTETVKYQSSDAEVFTVDFLIDFASGNIRYERQIDLTSAGMFTIGSAVNANIAVNSPYVQGDVIRAAWQGTSLLLEVTRSRYGVYHNGNRIDKSAEIKDGDFFSVSDFFFYLTGGVLLTQIRSDMRINGLRYTDRPMPDTYPMFNRSTRLRHTVCQDPIEVLDPPEKPQEPKNNLLIQLLPSLGMIVACGVMAFFGRSMILFSVISGSMGILTSILTIRQSKKDYRKGLQDRVEKYTAYVARKREEIEAERQSEKTAMEEMYVSQEEEERRFAQFSPLLFERTAKDEDFLCVRLGSGSVEARRRIDYKKQERLELEDELQQMPEQLSEQYRYIQDAPVVCDLKSVNAVGVTGSEAFRFDMLKNMVVDIAARQYCTDVRMVFATLGENVDRITWLRMLPHVYDEASGMRLLVTDGESKDLVFEYLYKELTARAQAGTHAGSIVVFLYDECGFRTHPVSRFVDTARELGVTFVFFGQESTDIPLGCGYVIAQQGTGGRLVKTDDRDAAADFVYPHISDAGAEQIVDLLAPVYTEAISLAGSLTRSISLFELLNILSADDIDLQERWNMSQVYSSMAAPIGVSVKGVVTLDLHDKAHGPHGLVAGTTGSGKSELLQTYILSMSTLFHPYEVGFVIIDFKGGGMVNQFKALPHLLGAITNIDGKEIERSLKSIRAELQKRQRLFKQSDVNHIDKYIRKYRAGEVSTPLPHLILIVDEFAELKAQQPEFMKELISTARIGRSLGVHLILATQKPAGQVDDQIWSNSHFKLCLKVATPQDSNEVLKSPVAAEIREPGRAYMQVGNNEIFELFQSAYSGAPERDEGVNERSFSISQVNLTGRRTVVYEQRPPKAEEQERTQLDAIVDYIAARFSDMGLQKLPDICLPSLPKMVPFHSSRDEESLSVCVGIYDDPERQFQGEAVVDLAKNNLLVIGSSQTGKTNLLQVLIRGLASQYAPGEVNIYVADFGTMVLKNFESLAHVGGVVCPNEQEKLENLFKLLNEEIAQRKQRLMAAGVSSFAAYREAGRRDMPLIVLMVDNIGLLREMYFTNEDPLLAVSKEGLAVGISVVIANSQIMGIGYRYLANFNARLTLYCSDSADYSTALGGNHLRPANIPGRCVTMQNGGMVETQLYLAFEGEKEYQRVERIESFIRLRNAAVTGRARPIPVMPELVEERRLREIYGEQAGCWRIGLNYADMSPVYLDCASAGTLGVVSEAGDEENTVIRSVVAFAGRSGARLYLMDGTAGVLEPFAGEAGACYIRGREQFLQALDEIYTLTQNRYDAAMGGGMPEEPGLILILAHGRAFADAVSDDYDHSARFEELTGRLKGMGVCFLFIGLGNERISSADGEVLCTIRDNGRFLALVGIQELKAVDVLSSERRSFPAERRSLDAFYCADGKTRRVRLAMPELSVE